MGFWFARVAAVMVVAGCGSSVVPGAVSPDDGSSRGVPPSEGQGGAEVPIELPSLASEREIPPRRAGPAPDIRSFDEAEEAFRSGWYEGALAYAARNRSTAAVWLTARILHAVGRYREAAAAAERVVGAADLRDAAETLAAEARMAVGDYASAEATLREVAARPGAWRARVLLARRLTLSGRKAEAERFLYEVIGAYNDETIAEDDAEGLTYVAQAAWWLGSIQEANDTFRDAVRADSERVETQLAWAELFLEKYDAGHAEESIRAALQVNPNRAEAHVLMARLLIQRSFDFGGATSFAERALEINPNLVSAHATLAGIALRDLDFDQATVHLDRAAAVNPSSLTELTTRAAMAFLRDDDDEFASVRARILQQHPGYADLYISLSEYADWEHRYPEIVEMAREALRLDRDNAYAQAILGINLLRLGEEEPGVEALREAWEGDRFNVRVFNLLNLYEEVIPDQYEELASGPFVFRLHQDERPVLERYVPAMLRRAYREMVERYGFRPSGPLRIELFRNPEHFSVRTTGLPHLGVQGVCFGKVVTALSPGAGSFNWGQITWHELAHVFHIQLSRNRVPRWFTEGLAEYETVIARPEWKREEDHRLYASLAADRLPSLRLMNRAFTRARSAVEMMTAYYASSQVVAYLVERFDFDRVVEMLRAWGRGLSTSEVFQQVLGETIESIDSGFRDQIQRRLSSRRSEFVVDLDRYRDLERIRNESEGDAEDASKRAALALAYLVAGNATQAESVATEVVERDAQEPLARFVLARVALSAGRWSQAEEHVRVLVAAGRDGYDLRLMWARSAAQRRDAVQVRRQLEAAAQIDADRAPAWQGLLELSERTNDRDLQLRALTRLVDIDQHDPTPALALLRQLEQREDWGELVRRGESMIYLDPLGAAPHALLAEAYLKTGRPQEALFEFESALLSNPESEARLHLGRARALQALGRTQEARAAANEASAIDPSISDEAEELLRRPTRN